MPGLLHQVPPAGPVRAFAYLVILLAGLACSAGADQWNESYEKGQTALREERYREAVTLFTDAIDQKPESKANARTYGVRFIDYFPYYYRGVARAHLGETALALADFQKEDQIGEVYNGKQDTQVAVLLRERLDAFQKVASKKSTQGESAQRQASVPTTATGAPPSSAPGAEQAEFKSDIDTLFSRATGQFVRGNIMSAKGMFLEIRKRNARYLGVDEYLKKIRGTEQDVKKGIVAFFKGKYRQAVEVLGPATRGGIDHTHAHAILGCSYAALYLLSGRNDREQRKKAEDEFRRVSQLDPRYVLNPTFVSPSIRELYASTVSH